MKIPAPRGRFTVGVADVEVESTLFRLFYPANPGSEGKLKEAHWIPNWKYTKGYGDFMNIPSFISIPVLTPLVGFITLPKTAENAPLLKFKEQSEDSSPKSSDHIQKLPLILFSHGLGGMRTTYSQICSELASYGFVVASIEHRDLSASCSLAENGTKTLPYKRLPEGEDEYQFRSTQLHQRVSEMIKLYEALKKINEGEKLENSIPSSIDLSQLKSRLDFSRVSTVGHSFGAATALQTAVKNPDLIKSAVCLDIWCFPIESPFRDEPQDIKVPLLFINSDEFQWVENTDRIIKYTNCANETQGNKSTQIITLKDTAHQNQSDFAFALPLSIVKKLKMVGTSNPVTASTINNRITLKFLYDHMNIVKDDGVSQDNVLDESVEKDGMFYGISERLKKPNETPSEN